MRPNPRKCERGRAYLRADVLLGMFILHQESTYNFLTYRVFKFDRQREQTNFRNVRCLVFLRFI
jgi:hypothetical protein